MVSYKSLQRKDLTRRIRPCGVHTSALHQRSHSCHCCQQVQMNHGDLLPCRCASRGRSVPARIALYYYYSRAAGNSAQRKSAHTFCQNLWFFRLVVTCNSRSVSLIHPIHHCYTPHRLLPRFRLSWKSLISKVFAPVRIFGRDRRRPAES